jgi:hypothetical protein
MFFNTIPLTARVLIRVAHQLQEWVVLVALDVVVGGAPAAHEPHSYAWSLQSLQDCGTNLTKLRVGWVQVEERHLRQDILINVIVMQFNPLKTKRVCFI